MTSMPEIDYASVRLQNNADVKVSWVSIGKKPYKSDFGILGNKGAEMGAVVPICFSKAFPIRWREGSYEHGVDKYCELDLRPLRGNTRLTIYYKGNDVWGARPGDDTTDVAVTATNSVSNVTTNK
jgi:hypothetical protein